MSTTKKGNTMTVNKMPLELVVNKLDNSSTKIDELEDQFWEKLEQFNEDCRKLNETLERLKGGNNG
jgi:DNA repair ATPase RecN|tara:strand:+ start:5981 stop:6178 length:198 start_codon:yes stop_codon:yes gene_type:complete